MGSFLCGKTEDNNSTVLFPFCVVFLFEFCKKQCKNLYKVRIFLFKKQTHEHTGSHHLSTKCCTFFPLGFEDQTKHTIHSVHGNRSEPVF